MYDPKFIIDAFDKATRIGTSNRSNLGGANRSKEPGPGQYSNVDGASKISIGYSIGKATRIDSKKVKQDRNSTPGPGAYRIPYYVAEVPSYVM